MRSFAYATVASVSIAAGILLAQTLPAPPLRIMAIEGRQSIALSGRAPQGLDVDLDTGLVYVANNGSPTPCAAWPTARA